VMDPVNVSIHFHKKWKAIFSKLIKSAVKICGVCVGSHGRQSLVFSMLVIAVFLRF